MAVRSVGPIGHVVIRSKLFRTRLSGHRSLCTRKDKFSYLADREYWEQHYVKEGRKQFEWLLAYSSLSDYIHPYLPKSPYTLLDVGCGNSMFTRNLIQRSQVSVDAWCLDFSHEAVLNMGTNQIMGRDNNPIASDSHLYGVVADAKSMPFKDNTFDLVIDKGTTDSLLKGVDGGLQAVRVIKECLRVVSRGGALLQITDEDPDLRLPLLELGIAGAGTRVGFSVIQEPNGQDYFLYGIKK